MRATFCAHLMLLNLIFLFIFGEEYKFWNPHSFLQILCLKYLGWYAFIR
jgi:hypothetical protein